MTRTLIWNDREIVISTDIGILRECYAGNVPFILALSEDNHLLDTSFARFAIEADMLSDTEDVLAEALGSDFLGRVIARCDGTALEITETDRLIIRELTPADVSGIIKVYRDAAGTIEPFYENEEDAAVYLKEYADNVYDLYGCGIWGMELDGEIIGVAGFTVRDSDEQTCNMNLPSGETAVGTASEPCDRADSSLPEHCGVSLELGYAVASDYRMKGYCCEACRGIIEYARRNLEYDEIFVRVMKDNEAGLRIAERLRDEYAIAIKVVKN